MIARGVLGAAGLVVVVLPLSSLNPMGLALIAAGLIGLWWALTRPEGAGPAVLLGAGALSWLVFGGEAHPVRLIGFALAFAAVHSSAALAATVPAGARLDRPVLLRWAVRTAGTTALGVGVVAATSLLPRTTSPATTVALAIVAVTGVVVAGAVLALRRPGELTRTGHSPDR